MNDFIVENRGGDAPKVQEVPAVTEPKRRGGRPKKTGAAGPAAEKVEPSVDRTARRQRKPFGSHSQKLAYPPRAGYHRHWFNDTPGRVDQAKEAGYEHVLDDNKQPVRRPVGTSQQGGVLFGYLMEIPREWYEEDMIAQQKVVNRSEEALARGAVPNTQGESPAAFYETAQGRRTSIRHGVR